MTSRANDHHRGTSMRPVDSAASCLITRFRLRSPLSLLLFVILYKRIIKQARVTGLLKTAFLIENLHTCYTLSLWADERSLCDFNTTVRSHIDAANSCFRFLRRSGGRPELWSAQFRLCSISSNNLNWPG